MISYKVITWNVNLDRIEYCDIMPYLYKCLKEANVSKEDLSLSWLKEFIDKKSMYQYWARCEYETIVTGWPKSNKEHKLDVYEQIKMNLDNITLLVYNDLINS